MSGRWGPKQVAAAVGGLVGAMYILVVNDASFESAVGAFIWACLWLYEAESK